MSETGFKAFEELIAPLNVHDFMKNHWMKQWVHIPRGDSGYYDFVLHTGDIDTLLQNGNLPPGLIRVLNGGTEKGKGASFDKKVFYERSVDQMVDSDRLLDLLKAGSTVEINTRKNLIPGISNYIHRLGKELCMPSVCKIFITPPQSKALEVHFDLHEVFVLQISGTKTWKLYNQSTKLSANPTDKDQILEEIGEPVFSQALKAGDLLYVPAGLYHEADTGDETSIHITIGIKPLHWFDLFEDMVEIAMDESIFQQKTPDVFATKEEVIAFKAQFVEKAQNLITSLNLEELLEKRKQAALSTHPDLFAGKFNEYLALEKISMETPLQPNRAVSASLVSNGKVVNLMFSDQKLTFPKMLIPVLEKLLQTPAYTLNSLDIQLATEMLLPLARKLAEAGVIQPSLSGNPI